VERGAVSYVLEMAFQSRQKSHVVLGLHEERAQILTQVLEGIIQTAVDLHKALDSWCFQLFIEGAQCRVSLAPVIDLRQRSVSLLTSSNRP